MEKVKEKKHFTIAGYSIYYILGYFTIYSVIGFIIETIFGFIADGVIESRKSFLYGPFCAIYGVGAVVLLIEHRYLKKDFKSLFIGGAILGSLVEYLVSLIGELIFHVKWWDYSNMPLNIQGRVCVYFSLFWGILSVCFLLYIHPSLNKIMGKVKKRIPTKALKIIIVLLFIFQFADWLVSTIAVELFTTRKIHEYDLNVENRQEIEIKYQNFYTNDFAVKMTETIFDDRTMIKAFPNLKIEDKDGNIIFFRDLVGDITPYYFKLDKTKIWRYIPKINLKIKSSDDQM